MNCFGLGKGTYGICQSYGSYYGGSATFSHHDNNQYNASNFNGSLNAVIINVKVGLEFQRGRYCNDKS